MTSKKALRQMIRLRKQEHSAAESSALLAALQSESHFANARTLLLYSALPDEVQINPLFDVAVIPGMAFDADGHRLGRGKGYYDRFLPLIPRAYKIGLCFPWPLVDEVPSDAHDIMMDGVISQNAHQ